MGHLVARYSYVTEKFIISEPVNGKTVVGLVFFPSMFFLRSSGMFQYCLWVRWFFRMLSNTWNDSHYPHQLLIDVRSFSQSTSFIFLWTGMLLNTLPDRYLKCYLSVTHMSHKLHPFENVLSISKKLVRPVVVYRRLVLLDLDMINM